MAKDVKMRLGSFWKGVLVKIELENFLAFIIFSIAKNIYIVIMELNVIDSGISRRIQISEWFVDENDDVVTVSDSFLP